MKQPKTLYLLDDDNDDLDLFCEAVQTIDNSIICTRATNSDLALRAFRKNDVPLPDMIFLDLNIFNKISKIVIFYFFGKN